MYYRNNGSQFSPCIISKAKYALRLNDIQPINDKRCSINYWKDVCQIVGEERQIPQEQINNAINRYYEVFN